MASGGIIALPEPLHEDDAKSWFRRFEVCAAANEWDDPRKLLRLPTLLRGRAWAIFDALSDEEKDTYTHLKEALLRSLNPDTEEDRLSAREELARRRFREGQESVDELARDIEKLLDKSSPGLPAEIRDSELRYHLTSSLPPKIAFQLKLLPRENYRKTVSKARELLLIYERAADPVNVVSTDRREEHLDRLEEGLREVSQQIAALSISRSPRQQPPVNRRCFRCSRPGHLARNCMSTAPRGVQCFSCGARGHVARNCQNQGNGAGGVPSRRAGGAPHFN